MQSRFYFSSLIEIKKLFWWCPCGKLGLPLIVSNTSICLSCTVCAPVLLFFLLSGYFEQIARLRLLYYKLNDCKWSVSLHWVPPVAAWAGVSPSTGHPPPQPGLSWVLAVSAGGRESRPLPRSTTAPQHQVQTRAVWILENWQQTFQVIGVNVRWFVESDRLSVWSETLSVDIVTDSSPCSRL